MFCANVLRAGICISETPSTMKLEDTCGYPKIGRRLDKKQAEEFKERRKKWDADRAVEAPQRTEEITE